MGFLLYWCYTFYRPLFPQQQQLLLMLMLQALWYSFFASSCLSVAIVNTK